MFAFHHQFVLSRHEVSSLWRICLFIATIYVTFWFAAPVTTAAPTNDLLMLQLTESFTSVDKKIASVAEKKMRMHLWYLSEDLAALPLFSDDVSDDDKGAIVSALQKEPLPEDLRRLAPNQIPQFQNLSVVQFVTRRSLNLFEALRLPQEFLAAAVNTWTERADYSAAQKTVHALSEVLTKSDEQRQLLYQVIEHHRKLLPTSPTKRQLIHTQADTK